MNITRRDLLKTASVAATGSLMFPFVSGKAWANGQQRDSSTVVLIRDQRLFAGDRPDPDVCRRMLDEALCRLTGKETPDRAWKSIVTADDTVGVKTNEWNKLPTPSVLEDILKEKVLATGVKEENLSIRDRGVLNDPVFRRATALINIRPMRTHAWSGVGTLIKNYIMFSPKPSSYHGDSCASLATLFDLPEVKGKTRLHILVMFTPQFHHTAPTLFSEEFTWRYNGLLLGFDPVAVDATGLKIIESKRKDHFDEHRPLNPPAKHILLADTQYRLGNADPSKIRLIKLGWDEASYV
ncbi:MAG: twin-arginine translocation signal domain-containing protein [Bacteroidales bacterium]|jgi:hypothetical protein|nr:twin-arginine translocation signal domain-containing protein [Bacteroidales bacterium]